MLIISTLGLAIFSLINSNLNSFYASEKHIKKQQLKTSALAFIESVNPMIDPSGEYQLGSFRISWTSDLVEPVTKGRGRFGTLSLYKLGLFQMIVTVSGLGHTAVFSVKQVGFEQVTEFNLGF